MKEFLVGLLALLVLTVMSGAYLLMAPFFMVLAFFLRVFLTGVFVIFCVWLLGKLIVTLFDSLEKPKKDRPA